jgi:hypothetical protein
MEKNWTVEFYDEMGELVHEELIAAGDRADANRIAREMMEASGYVSFTVLYTSYPDETLE